MALKKRKSTLGSQQWSQFHIYFVMPLYYKMEHVLLQNAAEVYDNSYDKMRRFYYKMRRLLQNMLVQ